MEVASERKERERNQRGCIGLGACHTRCHHPQEGLRLIKEAYP